MFFFFNDTATTEIYTLSLHDALPIFSQLSHAPPLITFERGQQTTRQLSIPVKKDRKSTRLNSSHANISYAVFCLKKKKKKKQINRWTTNLIINRSIYKYHSL